MNLNPYPCTLKLFLEHTPNGAAWLVIKPNTARVLDFKLKFGLGKRLLGLD